MGKIKKRHQITVGFALETDNEEDNAAVKLKKKNFDFIVLNSLNDEGAGFAHDTNRITIIDQDNKQTKFELKSKMEVANDIVQSLRKLYLFPKWIFPPGQLQYPYSSAQNLGSSMPAHL